MPYMLHVLHVPHVRHVPPHIEVLCMEVIYVKVPHVPYTIHESVIHAARAARAVRMARNSQSWFRKNF